METLSGWSMVRGVAECTSRPTELRREPGHWGLSGQRIPFLHVTILEEDIMRRSLSASSQELSLLLQHLVSWVMVCQFTQLLETATLFLVNLSSSSQSWIRCNIESEHILSTCVHQVEVPQVSPGQYVLSFRWDCEQTSQIWTACANINIV